MLIRKNITFVALTLGLFFNPAYPEQEARYFDQAKPESQKIRLAVFHESTSTLKTLIKLRKEGILWLENIIVISVFHEKESKAHQKSSELIKEKGIDWIKFHMVSGNLNQSNLFRENDLTPEFGQIFKKSDGIILFGGKDIPPYVYGEKTSLLTDIQTPYRHYLELSLVFHLLGGHQSSELIPLMTAKPDFPVLGICLGAQTINVGTGGSMIQDIPSEIYGKTSVEEILAMSKDMWHENPWDLIYPERELYSGNMHPIQFLEEGMFTDQFGFKLEDRPLVWSSHHQTVQKRGKGVNIIATSLDGKVVEAIAHDSFPHVLGVQFHPESINIWDIERRFKFSPEDKTEVRLIELLKDHPPSLEFHKKIWDWFSSKLEQYHRMKTGSSLHPHP